MKKTLRILAVAIFSLMLFQHCQKSDFIVVTGVVRDSLTNQPLENVYIFADNHWVVTGSDGIFTVEGIKPGKTEFYAYSLNGYKNQSKPVIITGGQINKFDFNLSKVTPHDVETGNVTNITVNSAKISGSITVKSGEYVSNYGHCWSSISTTPTIEANSGSTNFGGTSSNISFTSNLPNLATETIYYVRSYAVTQFGTFYGNTVAFKTSDIGITSGMILYYPFEGSHAEVSGNGFWNYAPWGLPTLTSDRFGNPNNAVEFQAGINDDMGFNRWPYFDFNDFSISLWFNKPSFWEAQSQKMFTIGYPWVGIKAYISQGASPNNITCGITAGGVSSKISLSSYPSVDKWHNIILQRRGSQLELYLDGKMVGNTSCNSSIINNYDGWMFLGFTWMQETFRGKLDDLRIYNRALSSSEIQFLYTH